MPGSYIDYWDTLVRSVVYHNYIGFLIRCFFLKVWMSPHRWSAHLSSAVFKVWFTPVILEFVKLRQEHCPLVRSSPEDTVSSRYVLCLIEWDSAHSSNNRNHHPNNKTQRKTRESYFPLILSYFVFWIKVLFCSNWPPTHYVAEDGVQFQSFAQQFLVWLSIPFVLRKVLLNNVRLPHYDMS